MLGLNTRSQALMFVLAIAIFGLACQQGQIVEYSKYENDAAVPRIAAADAKKEVDAGNAVLVDSRPEAAFKDEHLPGALNIMVGSTEDKYSVLPKGKKIIAYCT
jgi:hypothetical protein